MDIGTEAPCHIHVSYAVANSSDVYNFFHSLGTWTSYSPNS